MKKKLISLLFLVQLQVNSVLSGEIKNDVELNAKAEIFLKTNELNIPSSLSADISYCDNTISEKLTLLWGSTVSAIVATILIAMSTSQFITKKMYEKALNAYSHSLINKAERIWGTLRSEAEKTANIEAVRAFIISPTKKNPHVKGFLGRIGISSEQVEKRYQSIQKNIKIIRGVLGFSGIVLLGFSAYKFYQYYKIKKQQQRQRELALKNNPKNVLPKKAA